MTTSTTTHTNGYQHVSGETLNLDNDVGFQELWWAIRPSMQSIRDYAPHLSYDECGERWDKAAAKAQELFDRVKKLPSGKDSMRDYDLEITRWGIYASQQDQDLANAIMCHRRIHGDVLDQAKALNIEYLLDVIASAKPGKHGRDATVEDFEDTPSAEIFAKLGLSVKRLVRIVDDDGSGKYHIETTGSENVYVGPIGVIASQNRFRSAVGDATGRFPKRVTKDAWDAISQKLLDATETLRPGDPGHPRSQTIADETRGLVRDYFETFKTVRYDLDKNDTPSDLGHRFDAFVKDGKHHLFISELSAWIADHTGERIAAKVLGPRLREAGFEHDPNCWVDGRRRKVWKVDSRIIGQW